MASKKKTAADRKTTYVALVVDTSGSMAHLATKAKDSVNEQLKALADVSANDPNQVVYYTVVAFDSTVEVLQQTRNAASYEKMVSYPVRGMTALRDGVKRGVMEVEEASTRLSAKGDDVAFLVVTFTDGGENNSFTRPSEFKELMSQREAKGNWTFTFQLPPGSKDAFVRTERVNPDNVREWEQTAKGMEEATEAVTRGYKSYFSSRATGASASTSFYQPVTTDLSKVKATTIKKKLDDLSGQFKAYTVPTEQPVKEFVEAKTKKEYVVGQVFYQLMKSEKIQPQKKVLIVDKASGKVWGGNEARDLVGLPTDGVTHAKAEPGNHAGYEIFVQSTSVNRKLPRGTKILVDPNMTKGLKPTWEAPATT